VLVEAGGDGSKMLYFGEEPLDAIAQLVVALVEDGWRSAMAQWPDVGSCSLCLDLGSAGAAVVATISQQHARARKCGAFSSRRTRNDPRDGLQTPVSFLHLDALREPRATGDPGAATR